MILTRDKSHGEYEIHSYEPDTLKINEIIYHQSVIVSPHQLELWPPQNFSELSVDNFKIIFPLNPDVVLLGTGEQLLFPKPELLKEFYENQIGIEIMTTLAACRTFNVLMSEGRNAVAALLIK